MLSSIFTLALLSTAYAAPEKRQATNAAQFASAANQLISAYIPASALPAFESAISEGAAAASVTGDAKALIQSAFLNNDLPDWFTSAIPQEFSAQVEALESGVDALRGTVGAVGIVPVVLATTTVDAQGSTIVGSITTNLPTATAT